MTLTKFIVECDHCKFLNDEYVNEIQGYNGTYLRSFFCKGWECGVAQVIRYKFTDGKPELVERIEPSSVFIQAEPETGITIRPRAKTR